MKYAWIENNRIRDVAHANPSDIYHSDVAVFYNTKVPDDAVNGDGWVNGQLVKPEPPPAPPPQPRTWTVESIRAGLTLSERVKWDNDSAPEIITAKQEMATPQELAHTTEVLALLVDAGVISQASLSKIVND
jgi:hypothetical protein